MYKIHGKIHYWGEMGEDVIDIAGYLANKIDFMFRPICWLFGHSPELKRISEGGMSYDINKCTVCSKRLNV